MVEECCIMATPSCCHLHFRSRELVVNFDRSTVKHALQNTEDDCHQWLSRKTERSENWM